MQIFFLMVLSIFSSEYNITNKPEIFFQTTYNLYERESAIAKSSYDSTNNFWIVEIDKETFDYNKSNPKILDLIIYHELGHILLHLLDSKDETFMNTTYLDIELNDKLIEKLKKNTKLKYYGNNNLDSWH